MPYFVKDKENDSYGFYGTTTALLKDYPQLNLDTLKYHLTRKKKPYITYDIEVYYGPVKK